MSHDAGMIVMWSGSIVTIPPGWALCDGNDGTPNLRDRFIIGAGSTYNPDDTGGSFTHTHDFTSDGHQHSHPAGTDIGAPGAVSNLTNSVQATGTTDPILSVPPLYALAFIMRL